MWGSSSPNGDWLVLNVWYDGNPETDVVRVVNVESGEVVSEAKVGAPQYWLDVADDGTAYRLAGTVDFRLEVLAPGADSFIELLSLPEGFSPWGSTEVLNGGRLGWIGSVTPTDGTSVAAVGIADVATGDSTFYELPGVALDGSEYDVGDWVVFEYYQPGVAWSHDGSKVYVAHANEPAVTEVDLIDGTVVEHELETPTAWLDRLAAFWNPAAVAKGPSAGATATAALDPDANTLYVASEVGEFVPSDDGDWHIEWAPQGLTAIDVATWEVSNTWDLPTGQIALMPDGGRLIGWGTTRTDTIDTTSYIGHPVVVIDTDSHAVVGELDLPYDDLRFAGFSPDGSIAYLTQWEETFLSVDLATSTLVGEYRVTGYMGGVFGESGLIATYVRN